MGDFSSIDYSREDSAFALAVPCGLCTDPDSLPSPFTVDEHTLCRLKSHIAQHHAQFVEAACKSLNQSDKCLRWLLSCAINVHFRTGVDSIKVKMNNFLAMVPNGSDAQMPKLHTLPDKAKPIDIALPTSNDSKLCQLCGEKPRHRWQHIAEKHLKKVVFECPHCSNCGSYEPKKVLDHIRSIHIDFNGVPVSNYEKYTEEIRSLQEQCYPDDSHSMDIMEQRWKMHKCESCGIEVARDYRKAHVYREHLKISKLFYCPLCPYSSDYDKRAVKGHMRRVHKEHGRTYPISKENHMKDQIITCVRQCFPDMLENKRFFLNR